MLDAVNTCFFQCVPSLRLRSVAISRLLRCTDVGYRSYDLVLKMVVDSGRQFGRLADIKCTRFAMRTVCEYCFGGLPVARTRANFQHKKQLEAAGSSWKQLV